MKQADSAKPEPITLATNNGDIAGGEIMLLNLAEAIQDSGRKVRILAPSNPGQLAAEAKSLGFEVITLPTTSRASWVMAIRRWRAKNKGGLLWCNGLLPAFATSLMRNRVVHLHHIPQGKFETAARIALLNNPPVLVPSESMQGWFPESKVLPNWVQPVEVSTRPSTPSSPVRVGFIGLLNLDKGVDILATAISKAASHGIECQLVIAGDASAATLKHNPEIRDALADLGDKVTYLGWVKPSEFFSQVDMVAIPSVSDEPFGLAAAEAMSARIPFIVTQAGALPEVVGPEYEHIVRPEDSNQLAFEIAKIAKLLVDNPVQVRQTAERMHERWQATYSPAAGAKRVDAFLRSIGL